MSTWADATGKNIGKTYRCSRQADVTCSVEWKTGEKKVDHKIENAVNEALPQVHVINDEIAVQRFEALVRNHDTKSGIYR